VSSRYNAIALRAGEVPMRCPQCGSDKFMEISMRLHSEDDVVFRSCFNCEHRWWERKAGDGFEAISLDRVLDLATVKRTA
jgi:transcriptional regulator NrdR family protein